MSRHLEPTTEGRDTGRDSRDLRLGIGTKQSGPPGWNPSDPRDTPLHGERLPMGTLRTKGQAGNGRARLSDVDRARLGSAVDFADLLRRHGFELQRSGNHYVTRLRAERTPSCHVYPPGVGRHGARGWSWHDYGDGRGGDALGFLTDVANVPFRDAVEQLVAETGYRPDGWDLMPVGEVRSRPTVDPPELPPPPEPIPWTAQESAVRAFLAVLAEQVPDADLRGRDYLAGRGIDPEAGEAMGGVYVVPSDRWDAIGEAMQQDADRFLEAGLAKLGRRGFRPLWWDSAALFVAHDRAGRRPLYVVARRFEPGTGAKYLNQDGRGGEGARRCVYGLQAIPAAIRDRKRLLIVEGPTDALAARTLGMHAIATLTRPGAGHAIRTALEPLVGALLELPGVDVLPDADPGAKGEEGAGLAAELVAWLRAEGIDSRVMRMRDLGHEDNDLGDVVARMKREATVRVDALPDPVRLVRERFEGELIDLEGGR